MLVVTQPAVASRTDPAAGYREEVEFLGAADRVFSCVHRPLEACRAAVLVCSPVLADFGANYRREVELGRRLAAAGVAVERFHYRGSGHSDGDRVDLGYRTMFDDARLALDHLVNVAGDVPVAVIGTRCGAIVAAHLCQAGVLPVGAPVALWEPVLAHRDYVREALRARAVYAAKSAGGVVEHEAELAAEGWVDILGIQVGRSLLEARDTLEPTMGTDPRPVLLVQLDPAASLRRGYVSLVAAWRAAGFDVEAAHCPIDETWWFTHDRLTPLADLLDLTSRWLLGRLTPTGDAP